MRLLPFLLICIALSPIPAQSQAIVEHFVGPPIGPGYRDGIGAEARFSSPEGIWADSENVYIADSGNGVIRKMTIATGQVTTIVGQQQGQFSRLGDLWGDGPSLYVTDSGIVRKVDPRTGAGSVFVGQWYPESLPCCPFILPTPIAVTGNSQHLYVLYSPALSRSTLTPVGGAGLREILLSSGEGRTLPSSAFGSRMPTAVWADEQFLYLAYASNVGGISLGRMDLATYQFESLFGFPSPTASPAPEVFSPGNLWGDGAGHLFFTDSKTVYEVELSSGRVTAVASAPPSAAPNRVGGIWGSGAYLYGVDAQANTIFRVDAAGREATTVAGLAPTSVAAPVPPSSTLFGVHGIWADGKYVYAADTFRDVIHKIEVDSGQKSIFISNIHSPMAVWGDGAYLYVIQALDGIKKVSLTTGETSVLATGFFYPTAITGDANFLYVADNLTIQRVSKTTGAATTLAGQAGVFGYANGIGGAARFSSMWGLWTDGKVIYASDNQTIRRIVIETREVGTFAGTPGNGFVDGIGIQAQFGFIQSLGGDGTYLYAADSNTVRRIALSNAEVTTIAGVSNEGPRYEDGSGANARFGYIQGLSTVGRFVFVADGRLRKLDLSSRSVTTVTGRNIVLSSGVFPSDQFVTQSFTGNGDFIYALDGNALYKVSLKTREVTHLAGAYNEYGTNDGRGDQARFARPNVLWSDGRYVYVDDGRMRRVDIQTGDVVTILPDFTASAAWGDGPYLYAVHNYNSSVYRIDLRTGVTTIVVSRESGLYTPTGIWGDAAYLYVPDAFNCVIQKITRNTGEMRVLAGNIENCRSPDVPRTPVDGTGTDAFFPRPRAITGDGTLLYVMDGTTIRTVDPQNGETHTIAGNYSISGTDNGVGADAHFFNFGDGRSSIWSDGTNLYVANGAIRRVVPVRPSSRVQFDLTASGGDYWKALQTPGAFRLGFGRLRTTAGGSPPGAVALFSYRPNGVLVSEASVPASAPVQAGRIYVEVSGPVNTGIAIANANSQPASISFYFTDASGVNFGSGSATIGPSSQIAAFFDEAPFKPVGSTYAVAEARTFTFSSSVPVGVIALRGYTNERSEFLMTTLPVASVSSSSTESILLPHFADGGGWRTQLLLVNPTDRTIQGTVQMDSTFDYAIPPRSSVNIATPGTRATTVTGTIRITPSPFNLLPVASTVFSFRQGGVVVTESGVATIATSRSFRLFAETGPIRTGIAVSNASSTPGSLQFTLLDFAGRQVAASSLVPIRAASRLSLFINEIPGLAGLPADFRGVLRVSGDVPVAVVGIRGHYNERGEFLIATTPALPEDSIATTTESIFPHIVTGSGYTTEFLLLAGGGNANGSVDFLSQSGESLSLPIQH